ncbi:MAG: hypothetical protein ACREV1_19000, partial [Gammaproteobacteria bacterium]
IAIPPLKCKQLPAFGRAVYPLVKRTVNGEQMFLALLAELDAVIEMVVMATGRERVWADALDPDQLIVLANKIMEVNAAFFSQLILFALNRAPEKPNATLGAPSSNASSSTDTGSKTSETTP